MNVNNMHPKYHEGLEQLSSLIGDETDIIANLSNAAALLKMCLPDTNWTGFYLYDGKELVLGPFQGLPACIRIPLGRGVCGKAALEKRSILVPDVHAFPGHIACDEASASEIVVPLFRGNDLFGVMDIDSPTINRFDQTDLAFLESFAHILMEQISRKEFL